MSADEETQDGTVRDAPGDQASADGDSQTVAAGEDLGQVGLRGRQIGDYLLMDELGHGGQGFVYLARDTRLNRVVALKLLPESLSFSKAIRLRFQREAEIASKLNHPGICTVYESGEHEGIPFIAMERIDGVPLNEKIKASRDATNAHPSISWVQFSEAESRFLDGASETPTPRKTKSHPIENVSSNVNRAVALIEEAARALHVAHEQGLIHRDIKPGNIMVKSDGRPTILDFGLARDDAQESEALTQEGDLMGTPAYMSPEQLTRQTLHLDRRSDIYSLGVTLYECVTLERPFDAATREALYEAILMREATDPRKYNPKISRDLCVILATSMDKDRNRRYQTALDFAEDLRRLRLYQPILARPAGPWLRLKRWRQRNPMLATFLATLFILLTLGLVWTAAKNKELAEAKRIADANAVEAARNAEVARAESIDKQRALSDLQRLSDGKRLENLEAVAAALWPATPERQESFQAWIKGANAVVERVEMHRDTLQALQHEALRSANALGAGEVGFTFASVEQQWQHDVLAELVARLERFAAPDTGTLASVQRRLDFAKTVRSITVEDYAREWERVIKDIRESDVYDGLEISPQLGLIPLDTDPDSELHEFLHLATHEGRRLPRRDVRGHLQPTEGTGVILILIPGANTVIGAQSTEPDGEHYDPDAIEPEYPREVSVEPFFISKFEMTQAQWTRVCGTNPSNFPAGTTSGGVEFTGLHPLEGMSWTDAQRVMSNLSLTLPTETQWEYAARAGTTTVYHTGNDVRSLIGYANIASVELVTFLSRDRPFEAGFADGFGPHAPVGSLKPNAFGLHDVHGNVWEWCLERFEPADAGLHRGGSYADLAVSARSAKRRRIRAAFFGPSYGLRPAATLQD